MPNLPSPLGPVEFVRTGIALWSADSRTWKPAEFFVNPSPPPYKDDEPQAEAAAPPATTEVKMKVAEQLPITLLPDTNFIPKKYVVHMHTQRCTSCGHETNWSQTYAYNEGATRTGFILGRFSHLVPVSRFKYNCAVEVQAVPEVVVPACFQCATFNKLDLSHLPRPTEVEEYRRAVNLAKQQVQGLKPQSTPAELQKKANGATPKLKIKTVDDLFS